MIIPIIIEGSLSVSAAARRFFPVFRGFVPKTGASGIVREPAARHLWHTWRGSAECSKALMRRLGRCTGLASTVNAAFTIMGEQAHVSVAQLRDRLDFQTIQAIQACPRPKLCPFTLARGTVDLSFELIAGMVGLLIHGIAAAVIFTTNLPPFARRCPCYVSSARRYITHPGTCSSRSSTTSTFAGFTRCLLNPDDATCSRVFLSFQPVRAAMNTRDKRGIWRSSATT
jgi:hypothetical protein